MSIALLMSSTRTLLRAHPYGLLDDKKDDIQTTISVTLCSAHKQKEKCRNGLRLTNKVSPAYGSRLDASDKAGEHCSPNAKLARRCFGYWTPLLGWYVCVCIGGCRFLDPVTTDPARKRIDQGNTRARNEGVRDLQNMNSSREANRRSKNDMDRLN